MWVCGGSDGVAGRRLGCNGLMVWWEGIVDGGNDGDLYRESSLGGGIKRCNCHIYRRLWNLSPLSLATLRSISHIPKLPKPVASLLIKCSIIKFISSGILVATLCHDR